MITFRVLPRTDNGVTAFNTSLGKFTGTYQTPNYPQGPLVISHYERASTTHEVCALEARYAEWIYKGRELEGFLSPAGESTLTPIPPPPHESHLAKGISFTIGTFLALQNPAQAGITVYFNRGALGDDICCYEYSQPFLGPEYKIQILEGRIMVNQKVIFEIRPSVDSKQSLHINVDGASSISLKTCIRRTLLGRERDLNTTAGYPLKRAENPIFILRSPMSSLSFTVSEGSDGKFQFQFVRF